MKCHLHNLRDNEWRREELCQWNFKFTNKYLKFSLFVFFPPSQILLEILREGKKKEIKWER